MQEKGYAITALKDILKRALDAVEVYAVAIAAGSSGTSLDIGHITGWDREFAQMSREEQAEWLIHLFEELVRRG